MNGYNIYTAAVELERVIVMARPHDLYIYIYYTAIRCELLKVFRVTKNNTFTDPTFFFFLMITNATKPPSRAFTKLNQTEPFERVLNIKIKLRNLE